MVNEMAGLVPAIYAEILKKTLYKKITKMFFI